MAGCSAIGCTNSKTSSPGTTFHNFPKDPELFENWRYAVAKRDPQTGELWNPSRGAYLCGDHFMESDFHVRPGTDRRLLKPEAVPSIFSSKRGKKVLAPPPPEPEAPPAFMSFNNHVAESITKPQVISTRNKNYHRVPLPHSRKPATEDASVSTEDDMVLIQSALPKQEQVCAEAIEEKLKEMQKKEDSLRTKIKSYHQQARRLRAKWRCCASSCYSSPANASISFHEFPIDDEARCLQWYKNLNQRNSDDSLWIPEFPDEHHICSKHFASDCYEVSETGETTVLKADAVPTIFTVEKDQSEPAPVSEAVQKHLTGPALVQDWEKYKKLYEKEQKTNQKLVEALSTMFTQDQVKLILRGGRGVHWNSESIDRALELKLACGARGYEHLFKIGFPLPHSGTLKKKQDAVESSAEVSKETSAEVSAESSAEVSAEVSAESSAEVSAEVSAESSAEISAESSAEISA